MTEAKSDEVRDAVMAAEAELRPALADLARRFGGKASIEVELPQDRLDDQDPWSGNVYKYSF